MMVELTLEGGQKASFNPNTIFMIVPLDDGKSPTGAAEVFFTFSYKQEWDGIAPHSQRLSDSYETVVKKLGAAK
tara:strand:+ start:179 stop:400 length:222 start_codon:yes stop_codon:yes gene_type:complete